MKTYSHQEFDYLKIFPSICAAGSTQIESTLFPHVHDIHSVVRLLQRTCYSPGPVHTGVTPALGGTQSFRETDSHRGSNTSDENLENWGL